MRRQAAHVAVLAALLIAGAAHDLSAQALSWARQAGGPNFDQGLAIASDAAGNSWATGFFTGSATFGRGEPNETTLTAGFRDFFVAKYDPNGALLWVKQIQGGDTTGGQPTGISLDAGGNSYVTGFFRFGVMFDDGTTLVEYVPGVSDFFIAKYDNSGNFMWARQGGPNFIPSVPNAGHNTLGISTDADGNSHVTGAFAMPSGAAAFFVAKYDTTGTLLWVKAADDDVGPGAVGLGISVDGAGNSFVAGYAVGSTPAGDVAVNGSFEDPVVPAGSILVLESIAGWTQSSGFTGIEVQHHAAGSPFDGNQHVELDGFTSIGISQNVPTQPGRSYELRFAFSPRPGTPEADNVLRVSWGGEEIAVLSADGSSLTDTNWTVHTYTVTGGPGSTTTLTFEDLGVSSTLGTYVDAVRVIDSSASIPAGLFLAKFDGNGTFLWVKRVAGGSRAESVSVGPDGDPRIAGVLYGTAVFGAGEAAETTLTATHPFGNTFVARYDSNGSLEWAKQSGPGAAGAQSIAVDAAGNAHIAGTFVGTAVFGAGEATEATIGSTAIYGETFVALYGGNGGFLWARQTNGSHLSTARGIAADADGNSYVTGTFGNVGGDAGNPTTVVFGLGEPNETPLTTGFGSGTEPFVAKYANHPANHAPVAEDQSVSTPQDVPVDITLIASDADGDQLTFSIVDQPARGTLTGTPPDVTYTPQANFVGSDSFTFRAFDGTVFSNTARVSLTVEATDILCGALISGSIGVAEADTFAFAGQAGQIISLALASTGGFSSNPTASNSAMLTLFSPSGASLGVIRSNSLTNFTLPSTGRYLIRVRATNFAATGTYNFSLHCLLPIPEPGTQSLPCGSLRSATMTAAAEVDLYAFSGQAGQIISLAIASTGGFSSNPTASNSATLTLFAPSGTALGTIRSNSLANFTLPTTGIYVVRVSATNLATAGSYNVSRQCLLPVPSPAPPLQCGAVRPGTLTAAAEVDLYSFSGQAGRIVSLAIASTGGLSSNPTASNSATLTLFAPSGTALGTIRSNSLANFTLPTTGTYVVRVSATNLAQAGSYNVSLQCLLPVPSPAPSLQCGAVQPGTLTAAAEADLYSFSGQAGRIVSLAIASTGGLSSNPTASNSATLTLFAPSGTALGTIRSNSLANFTLPTTGTYVVRVSATNLAQAGSYNVSLQCLLPVPSPAPSLQCGAVQPGTLTAAAEADLYSFSGQAGRIVSLAIASTGGLSSNPTASNSATLTLFAPSGTALGTIRSNSLTNFALPATGTYVVRVSATNLATVGSYNVNLSCLLPVPTPAATLVCGVAQPGTVTAATEMDLYAFSGQTGQIITLQLGSTGGFSTNPTASNSATVTLFAPSGMAVGTIRSNSQSNFTLPTAGTYVLGVRATNLATIGSYGLRALCPI